MSDDDADGTDEPDEDGRPAELQSVVDDEVDEITDRMGAIGDRMERIAEQLERWETDPDETADDADPEELVDRLRKYETGDPDGTASGDDEE